MKPQSIFAIISLFIISILLIAATNYQADSTVNANIHADMRQQLQPLLESTVVSTTADSGAGSLREAIINANQTAGSAITFNIPTSDSGFDGKTFNIQPLTQLPPLIKDGTIID